MSALFDKLVIKSNPQATEEIEKMFSSKGVLPTSTSKIKQAMKRSKPSSRSTEIKTDSSTESEASDDGNPNPPKKQDIHQHKGSGGTGGSGDGGPPKPPGGPAMSEEPGVNSTELIKRLHEQLIQLLNCIRDTFEHMIETLHPEAQRILTEQFNEFYKDTLNFIQDFSQMPVSTPADKIKNDYEERKNQIQKRFDNEFIAIIEANVQVNDIIRRVRETFEANIDHLEDKVSHTSAISNFDRLMADVTGTWLHAFNMNIAHKKPKEIQSEIEEFEKNIIKQFNILTGFSLQRIKGAQKRFFERKAKGTRSFVTSSTKPKFAGPLNVAESIKNTPKKHTNTSKGRNAGKKELVSWHKIGTPFGTVILKVVYKIDGTVLARLIVNKVDSDEAMRYEEIFNILDESCKKTPMEMILLTRKILDYLSTELLLEDIDAPDILARFNSRFIDRSPINNVEEAAATLCAILMFCESCELRNATGGKLERSFIRRVIKNIENGVQDPFRTAARGHYPPHLNPAQSSMMGGVAATRDALDVVGPQTSEGKKRADGISELGSDVSDGSGKDSHESSDEDKK